MAKRLRAARPRPADAEPVHLDAVPVAELVEPDQRFRCEPYAAVLRAGVCIERQQLHGRAFQVANFGGLDTAQPAKGKKRMGRANFGKCGSCELGAQVRARLEAVSDTEAPPSTLRSEGVPALGAGEG